MQGESLNGPLSKIRRRGSEVKSPKKGKLRRVYSKKHNSEQKRSPKKKNQRGKSLRQTFLKKVFFEGEAIPPGKEYPIGEKKKEPLDRKP